MLACLVLAVAPPVAAWEFVEPIRVSRSGDRYAVSLEVRVGVERTVLFEHVTSYARLEALSRSIVSSAVLDATGEGVGGEEVRIRFAFCLAPWWASFWCLDFDQVQTMTAHPPANLHADIPDRDGNRFEGHATWELVEDGEAGTRIRFASELRPLFFVPPLIGPAVVRSTLHQEAERVLDALSELEPGAATLSPEPTRREP